MTDITKPPSYLGRAERATWCRLRDEYQITDAAGVTLLAQLCRSLQLARECRETVAVEGRMIGNRPHPLLRIGLAAERAVQTALRALNLDLEPLNTGRGRPPGC